MLIAVEIRSSSGKAGWHSVAGSVAAPKRQAASSLGFNGFCGIVRDKQARLAQRVKHTLFDNWRERPIAVLPGEQLRYSTLTVGCTRQYAPGCVSLKDISAVARIS